MRQKSKAKGKRILGVVLALVFLISCIMTPEPFAALFRIEDLF